MQKGKRDQLVIIFIQVNKKLLSHVLTKIVTMPPPAKKKRKKNAGAIATAARRSTRSQKPLLSIEMIGKVGSFANHGDMMNICLAVGPTDAHIVRRVYLRGNFKYLLRIFRKNVPLGRLSKAKEALSAWMEVNTDWRGVKCTAELVNSGWLCRAKFEEDDEIMCNPDPLFLFNNPAVAIEFGMLEVLKHQVEVIGIDINALRWNGYMSIDKWHLLIVASCCDRACLHYLLSREGLDVRVPIAANETVQLWQFALIKKDISAETFESVVRHPSFGPNRSFVYRDGDDILPLHLACMSCIQPSNKTEAQSQRVAKVKILLDAGADPLLATSSLGSSLWFVTRAQAFHREEAEKVKLCQKLIDMMEEKIAAGK